MINDIKEIDTSTKEGKYLMMALALLTVTSRADKTPWDVIEELGGMVKKVYPQKDVFGLTHEQERQIFKDMQASDKVRKDIDHQNERE